MGDDADFAARKWLLRPAERENPDTDLDGGRPDGTAWSRGNRVEALIDGKDYFHLLRDELADTHAGDHIYLAAWKAEPHRRLDEHGTTLEAQLSRAVRAGVHVSGLFWRPYLAAGDVFTAENRRFATMLRGLGASVHSDQRVRPTGSHHQKFVVIRRPARPETDVAFVGGIDPCPSRGDDSQHGGDPQVLGSMPEVYGPRPAWHDTHLVIRGPAVVDVEHCFRERWGDSTALRRAPFRWLRTRAMRQADTGLPVPALLPPPRAAGNQTVQLLRTYPNKNPGYPFARDGEHSIARGYQKALHRARDYVYIEDQFLWSPVVAEAFAEALRRTPSLRLIAVVPHSPDTDHVLQVAVNNFAQRRAFNLLHEAGGERFTCYELESRHGSPIYVHSKICIIDDTWAAVGSANLNRRSWTYDTELTAALVDDPPPPEHLQSFAAALRIRLWGEHLGRAEDARTDLVDPTHGAAALRDAASRLDSWHATGRAGPRPPGHLRTRTPPTPSPLTKLWASLAARAMVDPEGRTRRTRNLAKHRQEQARKATG